MDGGLEGGAELREVRRRTERDGAVAPGRREVAHRMSGLAVEVVPGRELLEARADADQGLHLGGDHQPAALVAAEVERTDAERVARHEVAAGRAVPEREGEDAVEQSAEAGAALAPERVDH